MFKFNKDNIAKWAQKYDEHYYDTDGRQTEERLKNIFKRQRYLTRNNLYDILNWKSPRIRSYAKKNASTKIVRITQNSFATEDEKNQIESLLGQKGGLRGVGYPVASTILHFAFPDKYPIMDFRVIRSLRMKRRRLESKFDFWQRYCEIIRRISKKCDVSIRIIDKALWKYDKEQNSHLNKCE